MTSLDFGLPLTIMWTLDCFAIEEFSKLGEVFMRYMSVSIPFFSDTFCLISASTRARIIREVDQQTMGVDLKDHAGSFICLCLNADSPWCRTVHLYTWWAMGKLIILLTILNYLFLFIIILIILIILINCTPVHMVGNGHGQAHNLPQTF